MMANTQNLVTFIREIAEELAPFISERREGSRVWNGVAYVEAPARKLDPYALSWWSVLRTIADLLELQERGPTAEQRQYMKRTLFGGMGSFNDFQLDTNTFGEGARLANARLDAKRSRLFTILG